MTALLAAALERTLAAMTVSPHTAVIVRASDGTPWSVARVSHSVYQVTHRDGRHVLGGVAFVVGAMEGK